MGSQSSGLFHSTVGQIYIIACFLPNVPYYMLLTLNSDNRGAKAPLGGFHENG